MVTDNSQPKRSETTNLPQEAPKLFISYSWTNSSHVDWVLQLATDLKNHGVDVVIDRWHLREGQDAHSFMEKMVRSDDISKVALVCDRKYVERANLREGGVGIESQIVTSHLYGDVNQTKVVGIITESTEEGDPTLPIFLQNRIFIDFRDSRVYTENLQQLVRWAYNKPLFLEPKVGPRPAFLDEQVQFEPVRLSTPARLGHSSSESTEIASFLTEMIEKRSDFTVEMSEEESNDETVYRSIKSLGAIISQVINRFDEVLITRELSQFEIDSTIGYFEAIFSNYEKGKTSWSSDTTRFYGQFLFTSIISRCIRLRSFRSAQAIISSSLVKLQYGGFTAEDRPLNSLNRYLESLESRNKRLKLNRASLHSDLIKEMCETTKIDFVDYVQTDLILFFALSQWEARKLWWPDSLLYAADAHGALPWFVRAKKAPFRDKLMPLLGIAGPSDIDSIFERMDRGEIPSVKWQSAFSTANLRELANLDEIRASYVNCAV